MYVLFHIQINMKTSPKIYFFHIRDLTFNCDFFGSRDYYILICELKGKSIINKTRFVFVYRLGYTFFIKEADNLIIFPAFILFNFTRGVDNSICEGLILEITVL